MKNLFKPEFWPEWAARIFVVALMFVLVILAFQAWDAQYITDFAAY